MSGLLKPAEASPVFVDEGTIVVVRAYATNEAKAEELWNLRGKAYREGV